MPEPSETKTIILACLNCNSYPCTCGKGDFLGECEDCHKFDCDCGNDAYREKCPVCGKDLDEHPMTDDGKLTPEACHMAVLPIPEDEPDEDEDENPGDTEDH